MFARSRSIRRALLGASAVALLALVAGCGSGSDGAAGASDTTTSPASTSTSTTASSTPTDTESPTTTAKPSPTPFPTTSVAHATPWTLKDADFGYVSQAKVVSGGVQFSFDRATWLLADQVAAWNKANPNHQVIEADDYAIGNVSTRIRTFLLVRGAKIFGSVILSDQPEPQRISAAQFVSRVNASPEPVTCWIYHRYGGLVGDVVQLEEQYRP